MAKVAATILSAKPHDEAIETGLDAAYRQEASEALSEILASTYRLTIKSHIYHWNVVGPLFKSLHELTEDHYNALFAAADVIAERIRALGHLAPVRLGDAAGFAPKAADLKKLSAIDMVKDLIAEHESAVRAMREAATEADEAGDVVTADMLTDRLDFHEKALWMLRSIIAS